MRATYCERSDELRGRGRENKSLRRLVSSKLKCSRFSRRAPEQVREQIVENFRERMQLRRSLIELEDQNVRNSIEVKKGKRGCTLHKCWLLRRAEG